MKRSQIFICSLILLLAASCKTQEDIRREQTVQNLNEEVQQTKKTTANGNSRFNAIEEQMNRLNGQIEESNHNSSKQAQENKQQSDRIAALEEANKKQVEYLKALTEKVNNQSGYIEEVIASLAKLSKESAEKPAAKKKAVKDDDAVVAVSDESDVPATFDNGLKKFKDKKYSDARDIFEKVSENKKASKKNREGATHYLGMIELKNKKYEAAKVYFSKVFSENPNSPFAPASLLNLGKTFTQLKSKEEANMTYDELISRFPKSKEAQEAAKLKK
ncbi:MAG: tetratricopeptide repeat protein [Rhizobacter sp.]|nr:tetratricopeptide repeat protein [Bacteriovorax sp.]